LRLGDVRVDVDRPHLRIRPEVGKGRRARTEPLWWDAGTLDDITAWKAQRQGQRAAEDDLFICSVLANRRGRPLSRHALRLRFQRACRRTLGPERAARVTIHHGRHTFVSHALTGGRTLAEVRDAAGHSHVGITSIYLHVAVEDDAAVGDLFRFARSRP
jgi:site-specific recombinase XerC